MQSKVNHVRLSVPVFIYAHDHSGKPLKEITRTLTVAEKGGFVELAGPVASEHPLLLINMVTGQCISCHAVSTHLAPDGKAHVGILFAAPSPQFWGIDFSPEELRHATPRRAVQRTA